MALLILLKKRREKKNKTKKRLESCMANTSLDNIHCKLNRQVIFNLLSREHKDTDNLRNERSSAFILTRDNRRKMIEAFHFETVHIFAYRNSIELMIAPVRPFLFAGTPSRHSGSCSCT